MKKFESRTYNISEIIEWDENAQLILSPDFQRRSVWSEDAKSFLIDTILQGKPMPKIFMAQSFKDAKYKKVIIDGQQRLTAILDFYKGAFPVKKVHSKEYGNKYYEDLDEDLKKDFLAYNLSFDVLFELSVPDILDVFARINSYTVPLNKPELYNAKYVGYFKQAVSDLGKRYVEFFIDAKVLTKKKVARMGEMELVSDLLMNLVGGVQTTSNIESYYKKYEAVPLPRKNVESIFDTTMSFIGEIYSPDELASTIWNKQALFYTLFVTIAHNLYGVENLKVPKGKTISKKTVDKVKVVLDDISSTYEAYNDDNTHNVSKEFEEFYTHATKGTTNEKARQYRIKYLTKRIQSKL